jgi:hypothetical protein
VQVSLELVRRFVVMRGRDPVANSALSWIFSQEGFPERGWKVAEERLASWRGRSGGEDEGRGEACVVGEWMREALQQEGM